MLGLPSYLAALLSVKKNFIDFVRVYLHEVAVFVQTTSVYFPELSKIVFHHFYFDAHFYFSY